MASKTVAPIRPQSITGPLDGAENAAAAIALLSKLRTHLEDAKVSEGSEYVAWFSPPYACAIAAGIEALAASIEGHVDQIDQAMVMPAGALSADLGAGVAP